MNATHWRLIDVHMQSAAKVHAVRRQKQNEGKIFPSKDQAELFSQYANSRIFHAIKLHVGVCFICQAMRILSRLQSQLAWNPATMHALAHFLKSPCYGGVENHVSQLEIRSVDFGAGAGLQTGHKIYVVKQERVTNMLSQSPFTMRARNPAIASKAAYM